MTNNQWPLNKKTDLESAATVLIDPDIAWKLFSKSYAPEQAVDFVDIQGDQILCMQVLRMVSVMT